MTKIARNAGEFQKEQQRRILVQLAVVRVVVAAADGDHGHVLDVQIAVVRIGRAYRLRRDQAEVDWAAQRGGGGDGKAAAGCCTATLELSLRDERVLYRALQYDA